MKPKSTPLKISYCTTCKGRLHHLQQTLPANLITEANNPNVEFVILDYGSEDGLGDWIKAHYAREIESGRICYARFEAPHFKMAHAKNMAHRLATGDVLCNLDADNYLGKGFSGWLESVFHKNPDSIVSSFDVKMSSDWKRRALKLIGTPMVWGDGRIALSRENFLKLLGYDEKFTGWGGEDWNLSKRAIYNGLKQVRVMPQLLQEPICHSNAERIEQLSDSDRTQSLKMLKIHRPEDEPHAERTLQLRLKRMLYHYKRILEVPKQPNPSSHVGCGEVRINFSDVPTVIEPLRASYAASPQAVAAPIRLPTDPLRRGTLWTARVDTALRESSRTPHR